MAPSSCSDINVWHVLPNEVYLLVAVGLCSLWLRNGGLERRWPEETWQSWGWDSRPPPPTTVAVLLQLKDNSNRSYRTATDTSATASIFSNAADSHDLRQAIVALAIVWTLAAFGEEIGYRAYLMTRFGEMAGGGRIGKAVSLIAVSLLFGFGHFYKGPAGVVESTVSGLLLGAVYLVTGILWAPILAHGLSDTFAVTALYYGWFRRPVRKNRIALERCADSQPERLSRLAQNVVRAVELQRLRVAVLACPRGREVALERIHIVRTRVRYSQLLRNILV